MSIRKADEGSRTSLYEQQKPNGSLLSEKINPPVYKYIIETDDPSYAPVSVSDIETISNSITNLSQVESDSELLQPKRYLPLKGDIISLVVNSMLGSALLVIGLLSPLIDTFPNQFFWWTMAFPAIGNALADLHKILILFKVQKND